jgi:hypothetical protein
MVEQHANSHFIASVQRFQQFAILVEAILKEPKNPRFFGKYASVTHGDDR